MGQVGRVGLHGDRGCFAGRAALLAVTVRRFLAANTLTQWLCFLQGLISSFSWPEKSSLYGRQKLPGFAGGAPDWT